MHYYNFNISDYESHCKHLTEMEDLAYRRMLDWCYLHEIPLPESVDEIAKKILMRTHSESIANVLHEFFELTEDGWIQSRIAREIKAYYDKSEKAKAAAEARWSKKRNKINKKDNDANAMQTHSERNAIQDTRDIIQEPLDKREGKAKRFSAPTLLEVHAYFVERQYMGNIQQEAEKFVDFYSSKNWYVGKNKMKDWKAAARNWIRKADEFQSSKPNQQTIEQLFNGGIGEW